MAKKEINKDKKTKNFGKELKSELKKVSWPTFKQLVNNTLAVISIVVIVAAIVFVLDVCFESLNNFGIEKLKSLVSSEEEVTEEPENNAEVNVETIQNDEEQNVETQDTDTTQNSEETNTEINSETEVVQ